MFRNFDAFDLLEQGGTLMAINQKHSHTYAPDHLG